jgi:Deoxyhypusine synthase
VNGAHSFTGKKIDPPLISKNMTISQLVHFFGSTGYNARRLFEAANIMKKMIDSGCTICLTLAGALTPIGMGNTIRTLIKNGFVDWIVTTWGKCLS